MATQSTDHSWWHENNLRVVQTNLREIDAQMDVDALLDRLEEFSANVWMVNTGGIAAFYPTDLEYHYQTPYLDGDLIGEAVEKAHANDIRVISRFDFSKVHETIFEEKPEWAYRTADGEVVNYHGTVHTCVNGGYQHGYSLEILDEALSTYDVDGVFFNMFGYQEYDYSRNYYGPCHCENCRRRFREMYDAEVPTEKDPEDPVYRQYQEFQDRTIRELIDGVRELIDGFDRDVAVSTSTPYNIDIIHKESNTSVDRPGPTWLYSASENVVSVEDSWDDKFISNISINAVDIPYRFMGVSENETRIRLYENIASGSGLSFCINGIFEDYPDRSNFDAVKEIYDFHERHEDIFGGLSSVADVALIKPTSADEDQRREYRGVFRALKEDHRQFDVIHQTTLPEAVPSLSEYELVVVPDVRKFTEETVDGLADIQAEGTSIFATNRSFVDDVSADGLAELFSGKYLQRSEENRGAYVEVGETDVFGRSPERDWVFVDKEFSFVEFEDAETFLPYVTPAVYGPPERVGFEGNDVSDDFGAAIVERGGSASAYLPWQVGALYYEHGYAAHRDLLLDVLDYVLDGRGRPLTTDAPPTVEVFFDRVDDQTYLLQLLNLSGLSANTYFEPHAKRDVEVVLPGVDDPTAVTRLIDDETVDWENGDGTRLDVDVTETYEAILIEE